MFALACSRAGLALILGLSTLAASGCGTAGDSLTDEILTANYGDSHTKDKTGPVIDPILAPIVDEFLAEPFCDPAQGGIDCRKRLSRLSRIDFDTASIESATKEKASSVLGICLGELTLEETSKTDGGLFLPAFQSGRIHLQDWKRSDSRENLRALMYHELGHCIFYKLHYPVERGLNLMNPNEIPQDYFFFAWKWVLQNFSAFMTSPYGISSVEVGARRQAIFGLNDLQSKALPTINLDGKLLTRLCGTEGEIP